jgi:protein-tyrosine phosphatase
LEPELYWVEGPWEGRLAVAPRPRGGDWLADEVRSWEEQSIDIVISLLTNAEEDELGLLDESRLCSDAGIKFRSLPVQDMGVPAPGFVEEAAKTLCRDLQAGKAAVVHCRQGIGRSGLLAAATLIQVGVDAESAMASLTAARGVTVPETDEQRRWLLSFAERFATKDG